MIEKLTQIAAYPFLFIFYLMKEILMSKFFKTILLVVMWMFIVLTFVISCAAQDVQEYARQQTVASANKNGLNTENYLNGDVHFETFVEYGVVRHRIEYDHAHKLIKEEFYNEAGKMDSVWSELRNGKLQTTTWKNGKRVFPKRPLFEDHEILIGGSKGYVAQTLGNAKERYDDLHSVAGDRSANKNYFYKGDLCDSIAIWNIRGIDEKEITNLLNSKYEYLKDSSTVSNNYPTILHIYKQRENLFKVYFKVVDFKDNTSKRAILQVLFSRTK